MLWGSPSPWEAEGHSQRHHLRVETLPGNFGHAPQHGWCSPTQKGAPASVGCSQVQWDAVVTDAASCSGVLLAPGLFLAPRGCSWSPRDALTPVVPVGEQQARRRELLTAASCSRKLSTSRCAASARCKRAEQESDLALQLIPPHTGPGSAPGCASPEHPTPSSSITSPAQVFQLPPCI